MLRTHRAGRSRPFVQIPAKYESLSEKPLTVAGQPAYTFLVKEKGNFLRNPPDDPNFFRRHNDEETKRIAGKATYVAMVVFTNGPWLYLIT